jgi:LysM repeat protein
MSTLRSSPMPRRAGRPARLLVLGATAAIATMVTPTTPATTASAAGRRTCADSTASTYTVVDGDSWFDIATAAAVKPDSLLTANDARATAAIHPGDVLCMPAGAAAPAATCGSSTYTVAGGDGWSAIAETVGVRMPALLTANGATADTTLQPGQVLCLPAGATATSTSTSTSTSKKTRAATPLSALPLQGPCWFGDTWRDARSNGRTHEGVDLIAQAGKYVYAVTDGVLTRRAWDQPGRISGNAWWLTASDGSGTYFYYGHLYDFAQGLKVGSTVRAGQIIGFVGNTGDSATAHLHFEIHPNGGDPINPYPTVKSVGACNTGTPYRQPGGWIPDTGGVTVE